MATKDERNEALQANAALARAKVLQEELVEQLTIARHHMVFAGMGSRQQDPIQGAIRHTAELGHVITQGREDTVKRSRGLFRVRLLQSVSPTERRQLYQWECGANDELDAMTLAIEAARAHGIKGWDTSEVKRV